MRVTFAFTGVWNNRRVMALRIASVMLAIFFTSSSFTEHSRDLRSKQMNLVIRQIGDRLLLQAGDSTSRVLPVTESKEGTFLLRFENAFVFNHDSLMALTQSLLPKRQFAPGYTVTVHDCRKGEIVYGFQVNNDSPDILACQGRSQPRGCYTIEFAFPDFYENVKNKADIGQTGEAVKITPHRVNAKVEEVKPTSFDYNTDQQTSALKQVKADTQEIHSKPAALQTTIFDNPSINIFGAGLLLLLGVSLLIGHFRKIAKPAAGQHENLAIKNEPIPEEAALGQFLFDVKNQRLLLANEAISLTDKECKVLELLHKNFGELIPRETLMQEVWINEGVITGRSLDMFISKLRKKLSVDPDLRITNIHGKGYRLETVHEVIA